VPLSALFRHGDGWAVFRAVDGRARVAPVALGHRNGTAAEVTEGLAPGDRVILHPADAVTDGMPVEERKAG
jgi:HlyD family secretion protein